MITWFRVVCEQKHPLVPICDIERDGSNVAVHPTGWVRVPELVQHVDLNIHIQAAAAAIRKSESPYEAVRGLPGPNHGIVRTSHPDLRQGKGFWITCEMCKIAGGKKLSARSCSAEELGWVLDHLEGLDTIEGVEQREPIEFAPGEWEADPSQPRFRVAYISMWKLPLKRLQDVLTNNPRGATRA